MTELISQECVLTQEQRRRLGQVYRLILSWRMAPKQSAVIPVIEPPVEETGALPVRDMTPDQPVESRD